MRASVVGRRGGDLVSHGASAHPFATADLVHEVADDLACLVRGETAVGLVADAHDGGLRAGAHAGDGRQRELHVRGRLAVGDPEFFLQSLGDLHRPRDVAGGAVADVDDVLADRREPELVVEARDAVDLAERDAGLQADLLDARRAAGSRRPPARSAAWR